MKRIIPYLIMTAVVACAMATPGMSPRKVSTNRGNWEGISGTDRTDSTVATRTPFMSDSLLARPGLR
ncbi:MAG: hypothetical protein K2L35_08445, partial [Muribaculaceae bacterium]|nr:hypothetical protein [Muribaculaceae bacterium]